MNKKIAVITGAAGGMGAAVAARLAAAGWPLLLCDLDAGRLEPIAAEFRAGGCSAEILAGDIADPSYPTRLTTAFAGRDIGVFIHIGERGARIVSISPGLIDTAMTRAEQTASAQMKLLLARTPLARLGTADEIASVASFLCSNDASYVTGCDIRVDGGTLASLGL